MNYPDTALGRVEAVVEALEHRGYGKSIVSCLHGHEVHWPGENREYVPLHAGDLRDLVDQCKAMQAQLTEVARPWPRAQRMPLAIVGGRVQPWYLQAVAEYNEAHGVTTEPNSTIPGMHAAAQINRAITWWNERAGENNA